MENKGRHWNERQDDYVALNWSRLTDDELAESLGRSPYAIRRRRHHLGLHRQDGMTAECARFGLWSEGPKILTADEFVDSLGDMDANERLMRIDRRIEDVALCIARLFDMATPYRTWGDLDTRSLVKMQGVAKDLKRVRERVHLAGSLQSEAA